MNYEWIETTEEVYRAIFKEHNENFQVFGTCTLPEGDPRLGRMNPYILTEWGFKDAAEPIIKSIGTKKHIHQKEYDYKYFIISIITSTED